MLTVRCPGCGAVFTMESEGNLSLLQAAARLGISPYTLRSWAKYGGKITYIKAGRRLLFRPADLEGFERRNLVKARVRAVERGETREHAD